MKLTPDWKTVIRPAILIRANNACEGCRVPNHKIILRGEWNGAEAYQDDDGNVWDAATSVRIGEDYVCEVDKSGKNKFVKIVLTIAHLDHDIKNNDYANLKALCQRCHNRHDAQYRKANRRTNKLKKAPQLF